MKMLKKEASETESEKVRFLQETAINGQFWHPNVVASSNHWRAWSEQNVKHKFMT